MSLFKDKLIEAAGKKSLTLDEFKSFLNDQSAVDHKQDRRRKFNSANKRKNGKKRVDNGYHE